MTAISGTWLGYLFMGLFAVMGVLVLASLVYGVISRRFTDKIVAANIIGSLTLNIVMMLALYLAEDYIVDISLVYALLSFLAVVVLCRVVTDHVLGKMRHLRASNPEATKKELASAGTEEGSDRIGQRLDGEAPNSAAHAAEPAQKEDMQ